MKNIPTELFSVIKSVKLSGMNDAKMMMYRTELLKTDANAYESTPFWTQKFD